MQVMDEATELPHTKRDKDYTSFLYLAFVTKLLWVLFLQGRDIHHRKQ